MWRGVLAAERRQLSVVLFISVIPGTGQPIFTATHPGAMKPTRESGSSLSLPPARLKRRNRKPSPLMLRAPRLSVLDNGAAYDNGSAYDKQGSHKAPI